MKCESENNIWDGQKFLCVLYMSIIKAINVKISFSGNIEGLHLQKRFNKCLYHLGHCLGSFYDFMISFPHYHYLNTSLIVLSALDLICL